MQKHEFTHNKAQCIFIPSQAPHNHQKHETQLKSKQDTLKHETLTSLTLSKAIVRDFGTSRKDTTTPRTNSWGGI